MKSPISLLVTLCISCVLISVPSFAENLLSGQKTIFLIDNNQQQYAIGDVSFTPLSQTSSSYTIHIDHSQFADYFLSMKEMKCLEGPELWCHLRYPYTQPRTVTHNNFEWLAHDLLFMFKKPGEYGANFWNGIYYEMSVNDKGEIRGTAQAVDLNMLAAPPDDLDMPPFGEFERHETETEPRWLPFILIK